MLPCTENVIVFIIFTIDRRSMQRPPWMSMRRICTFLSWVSQPTFWLLATSKALLARTLLYDWTLPGHWKNTFIYTYTPSNSITHTISNTYTDSSRRIHKCCWRCPCIIIRFSDWYKGMLISQHIGSTLMSLRTSAHTASLCNVWRLARWNYACICSTVMYPFWICCRFLAINTYPSWSTQSFISCLDPWRIIVPWSTRA